MAGEAQLGRTVRNLVRIGCVVVALLLVFGVLVGLSSSPGIDGNKSKSELGCLSLATAIERYIEHEGNTKHEPPRALEDLAEPPFGGSSFLRNGRADLLDPWGKPYEMERFRRSDGIEIFLVKTTAPDGTPISQFGIGEKTYRPRD